MDRVDPAERAVLRAAELQRFRAWRRTGDIRLRDRILADNTGLAISLATRYRDRSLEFDDLVQVAQMGVLLAAERFDPDRGVPFVAFATPTVLGELRRAFRSSWSVRVPRGLQESSHHVGATIAKLEQEFQRTPTVSEVAQAMQCTTDDVLLAIDAASAFRSVSLDRPDTRSDGSSGPPEPNQTTDSMRTDDPFDQSDARAAVQRLLPLLSPRSRRIVELRFYEESTQSEIAAVMGMSQMHVSRLLRQALGLMAGSTSGHSTQSDRG